MTAPSAWAVQQALIIARATLQRMEATGTVDTDEAALLAVLRDEGADVEALVVRLGMAAREAEKNRDDALKTAQTLRARAARFDRQHDEHVSAIHAILDTIGRRSWVLGCFTASIVTGRAGVHISDSEALPANFVRVKREPDRVAIGSALASGATVPGAELRNTPDHVSLRWD